ncbi:RNA-binding protein 34, partial [Drosophila sulfurigaster albostrigata]|uniref:RNA-binding protein 34 n=1 Tax=Drosophila sulfurigaster albostrigata TaxID=89887 RepID=UPI002D21E0D6
KQKEKSKKPKTVKAAAVQETVAEEIKKTAKNLSASDLAKIEKKKAKKEAQKLKKQLRKQATETSKDAKEPKKTAEETKVKKSDTPKEKTGSNNKKEATKQKAKPKRNANDKATMFPRWREAREGDPADEAATVFVGNLPINTKRVQITRLFQSIGKVQSIRLRTAGGKQLFKHKQRKAAGSLNAYVVLESPEIAAKALSLNGSEFKECHLRVTPAAKAKAAAGDVSDQAGAGDADAKRTVFVGNLKYSANEPKLREIFSSCGEIDYIRCLQDGEKGCKGVAYVCFQKPDAVGLALELNETVLDDRPIHVERYSVKKLGAKQARDTAAAKSAGSQPKSKNKQNSAGAKKRLDKKKLKENGQGAGVTKAAKKSEYRGVKVDGIKKNTKKPNKKKSNNEMSALAKKIAPKTKT